MLWYASCNSLDSLYKMAENIYVVGSGYIAMLLQDVFKIRVLYGLQ